MKKVVGQKPCEICNELFDLYAQTFKRQRACKKLSCKLELKDRTQTSWVSRNPGCFTGRYPALKERLLENQRKRRKSQKNLIRNQEYDIQDELSTSINKQLDIISEILDIQDELNNKILTVKSNLNEAYNLIYTRRVK